MQQLDVKWLYFVTLKTLVWSLGQAPPYKIRLRTPWVILLGLLLLGMVAVFVVDKMGLLKQLRGNL